MIKFGALFGLTLLTAGLMSCANSQNKNTEEISLKADRKILDKYRAEIPEDIQKENDFMALVLKDMAEVKRPPQAVRDNYYKEVRRKRESFNKQHRQIREKFNRDEKKRREDFLKDLKKERDSFVKTKPKSSESSEFFSDQNSKRNVFFQDQSDRRKNFESEVDSSRRDFNDDMNLKQKQFDDAYREYLKNYQEKEKQKKLEMSKPPTVAPALPTAPGLPGPNNSLQQQLPPASYPGQQQDLESFDKLKDSPRDTLGN